MAKYELMEKTENNGEVWYFIRKENGFSVDNSWTKKLKFTSSIIAYYWSYYKIINSIDSTKL